MGTVPNFFKRSHTLPFQACNLKSNKFYLYLQFLIQKSDYNFFLTQKENVQFSSVLGQSLNNTEAGM